MVGTRFITRVALMLIFDSSRMEFHTSAIPPIWSLIWILIALGTQFVAALFRSMPDSRRLVSTKDGENRCQSCEEKSRTSAKRKQQRKAREGVMRSLGLVKVRGALGGTYWE